MPSIALSNALRVLKFEGKKKQQQRQFIYVLGVSDFCCFVLFIRIAVIG